MKYQLSSFLTTLTISNRCNRLLVCGHPCPSVCGEVCPPPAVACSRCAPPNSRNGVIDLIGMRVLLTFKNQIDIFVSEMKTLETYNVDKDEPLVSLECGHTFVLSTLDGTVGLDAFYSKDKGGAWIGLLELPSKLGPAPSCPHCREPIANVRRYPSIFCRFPSSSPTILSLTFTTYGRILAHAAMEQASIKFNLQTQHTCHQYAKFLEQHDYDLEEYEASDPRDLQDTRDINDRREKMRFTCDKTRDLCAHLKKNQPERRVYEMSVATLIRRSISILSTLLALCSFLFSLILVSERSAILSTLLATTHHGPSD